MRQRALDYLIIASNSNLNGPNSNPRAGIVTVFVRILTQNLSSTLREPQRVPGMDSTLCVITVRPET